MMFVIQNLEGAYAGRCRVGEASPNGWESVLAGLHSYSNASSGEDLFSLRNLNQNEEIFRDISLLANQWARAYVFHDPSFPLVSSCSFIHDLAQAIIMFFVLVPAASIPLVV